MKNRFYYAFLILGIVTLNFSCQKDDASILASQDLPKVLIETTSLSKTKDVNRIGTLIKKFKNTAKRNLQKQSGSDFLNQFTLDTTTVNYIEATVSHSYTFGVVSADSTASTVVRNLVLAKHNDMESYVALLMTYNLTVSEIDLIENGTYPSIYTNEPIVEIIDNLDPSALGITPKSSCVTYQTITFDVLCSHSACQDSGAHDDGVCGHPDTDSITVTILAPCAGSPGTGGFGTTDPSSPNTASGGGGINWGGTSDSPYNPDTSNQSNDLSADGPLTKIVIPKKSKVRVLMPDLLDMHDINFLNNYPIVESAFNHYLLDNSNTESFAFVDWGIDYLQFLYLSSHSQLPNVPPTSPENADLFDDIIDDFDDIIDDLEFHKLAREAEAEGGEVDFENEIIKDASFIGTKADCVLNELISSGNNIFKTVSEAFTNENSEYRLYFTVGNIPYGGVVASTSLPFDDGIIRITFDDDYVNGSSAIYLAKHILHETIHAELHRIFITNNSGPNPLPQEQFELYVELWEHFQGIYNSQNTIASNAEHYFMSEFFIDNIASGLREFDNEAQPLENYLGFTWEGLENFGVQKGSITQQEFDNYVSQTSTVNNDSHINNCDN
jgi:hypothetical protein